jgi:hypothetical protein
MSLSEISILRFKSDRLAGGVVARRFFFSGAGRFGFLVTGLFFQRRDGLDGWGVGVDVG